jgi:opacity protein-like surface antigen
MDRVRLTAVMMIVALFAAAGSGEAAEPGFYVAAGVGQAEQDVRRSDGIVVAFGSPFGGTLTAVRPDAISVDDDELSWNGVLGYRINRYIAAELAYMEFGEADVSERYTIRPPLLFLPIELTRDLAISVTGPAVSVLGLLPLGSRFDLFIRAGVLFADKEVTQRFTTSSQSMTFGSEVWLGGAGVDWSFANRWAVRLEYLRTGKTDADISSGESDLRQIALGVLFRL